MSESAEVTAPAEATPGQGTAEGPRAFRERLHATWWTWPLPVVGAALMAATVHMGYPGVRAWLPYAVLIPLAVLVPLWLGRTKIEVRAGELHVGDAHVPLRFVEHAEPVSTAGEQRRALGPELDPAAFVVHRPWVRTSVRVWLNDADDPTPYWVVSTRRPAELADVLTR
ncbi:DUF3093 domain-containing protein [Saccharopolyspora sp. CA-218241]|uniref:DUF3093 domain-containing protein n=1 Tax=Saccharopolyspora sp. CA-218241 TaxID=3240027 RepID=UPI003D95B3F1